MGTRGARACGDARCPPPRLALCEHDSRPSRTGSTGARVCVFCTRQTAPDSVPTGRGCRTCVRAPVHGGQGARVEWVHTPIYTHIRIHSEHCLRIYTSCTGSRNCVGPCAVCGGRARGPRCVAERTRPRRAGRPRRDDNSSTFALGIERNTGGLSCLNYIWLNIMRNK